jgi:hypothetical protein
MLPKALRKGQSHRRNGSVERPLSATLKANDSSLERHWCARDIRQKIADLKKLQSVLETMASHCTGGEVPECPIIDELFDPRTRPPSAKATRPPHREIEQNRSLARKSAAWRSTQNKTANSYAIEIAM